MDSSTHPSTSSAHLSLGAGTAVGSAASTNPSARYDEAAIGRISCEAALTNTSPPSARVTRPAYPRVNPPPASPALTTG